VWVPVIRTQALSTLQPVVVNREPREPTVASLKVITFNAKGGRHLDGIRRCLMDRPLAGANVILLCDADWGRRRSGFRTVAAELASELKMSFAFAPKRRYEDGSYGGNAILCSQPLRDVVAVALSKPRPAGSNSARVGEPHGMLATAAFNGRDIRFGVAHLTARWNAAGRKRQIADFIARLPPSGPVLIGGDFNTTTIDLSEPNSFLWSLGKIIGKPARLRHPEQYEPLLQHLEDAGFEVRSFNAPRKPTFTFARVIPPLLRPKLDWLVARQLRAAPGSAAVVAARHSFIGRRVSDHDFVMCEVRL
jgi:endonuclease/exonuclease/phosphatase family metal-dependent hydrolase